MTILILMFAKYILLIFLGFVGAFLTIITLLFIALGLEGIQKSIPDVVKKVGE